MRNYMPFFILFAVIALAILAATHWVLYASAVHFFAIASRKAKIWLGIVLGLLAVSFLAASFLVRWQDMALTKGLYFLAGIWLGILTYLVLCFAAAWIIGHYWASMPRIIAGSLALVIALGISAYGVWNAYHPRVKRIEVKIANLPEAWRGKTIVQISDVHLGNVFGKNFLAKVVAQTNAIDPEMVVITGDLFDGMGDDLKHSVLPLNDIKAPRGMYFVTGNHETFLPAEQVSDAFSQIPVKILNDKMVNLDGLQLIGVSYAPMGQIVNIAQTISTLRPDGQKPTILLYHSPIQTEEINRTGVDLMLAGHTHQGQLWPFNLITWMVYGGFDYGLFRLGKMQLYTTSGTGGWGPTMRIWARPEIVAIRLD